MQKRIFEGAKARIRGIPCLIRSDDWDGVEIDVYDRNGYPAEWLKAKATKEDLALAVKALSEHVSDAVLDAAETMAAAMADYRQAYRRL